MSDSSIREALIHEFARFGEVSVKIIHDSNERFAYLYFRCYEDAREARHAKYRLVLFDKPVEIDPIYEKIPPPLPPAHPRDDRLVPPPGYKEGYHRPSGGSRGRSLTPPEYHHRSRSPSYRNRMAPLSCHHLPVAPPSRSSSSGMVDRHGNPFTPGTSSRYRESDRERYLVDSYHGNRDPYDRPSGGRDPYDRPLPPSGSSSRLPSSPGGTAARPSSGGGGTSTTPRENKKDKFPNYLHHVAPEEDVNATRTLFVGNLEVSISDQELRRIFEKYGVVEDIDVKRPPPGQGNAYAFIKFLNLDMAHRAKVEMSGQYIGKFQCKIGYGKATPTTRIWVGGLGSWTSLSVLEHEFDRFGAIRKIDFVKGDNHAYIQFDSIDAATAACQEMRGFPLGGQDKRLRVDFADPGVYSGEPGSELAPIPEDGIVGAQTTQSGNATLPTDGSKTPPLEENGRSGSPNGSIDSNRRRPVDSDADCVSNRRRPVDSDADCVSNRRRPGDADADCVSDRKRSRLSPSGESSDNGLSVPIKADLITFEECPLYRDVETVQELMKVTEIVWTGGLKLKNSSFPCQMHLCAGDATLVHTFMTDQSGLAPGSLLHTITDQSGLAPLVSNGNGQASNGSGDGGQSAECVPVERENKQSQEPAVSVETAQAEEKEGMKETDEPAESGQEPAPKEPTQKEPTEDEPAPKEPTEDEPAPKEPTEDEPTQTVEARSDKTKRKEAEESLLPLIKVTQRLRLDAGKLEDVSKRITASGKKKCLLLVSPAPVNFHSRIPSQVIGESEKLSLRHLKNLISYFKARESAGVANLTGGATASGGGAAKVVMYCFPSCDYSVQLIKKVAPNFTSSPMQEFLLVLLVKG